MHDGCRGAPKWRWTSAVTGGKPGYFLACAPLNLAVWGENYPAFVSAGAEAYWRDNPNAVVKFYDTGRFALDFSGAQVSADICALRDGATF